MRAARSLLDFAQPARQAATFTPATDEADSTLTLDDAPALTPQHASPTAAQQPTDPDELAGQLYDSIRGRLRAELLIDRERAALLSDRH